MDSLERITQAVRGNAARLRVAIAPCAEPFVLRAALDAATMGLAEPVLIGQKERTLAVAAELGCPSPVRVHRLPDDAEAVHRAVDLYRRGRVQLIMKGLVSTATLLKAVLAKDAGLVAPGGILSLVSVFDAPSAPAESQPPRLMLLSDAGVNIRPSLQRKADILKNALAVARALGIPRPRAAVLAATEKVNFPAMPATLDADLLAKMGAEGAFGDAQVAGPLALDLAVRCLAN